MIMRLNPYSNKAKTAEIMSRYRPIAPKPEGPMKSMTTAGNNTSMCRKISQSPYLKSFWPQLQARPTRTRKRGRSTPSIIPQPDFKRSKHHHFLSLSTSNHVISSSPSKNLSLECFTTINGSLENDNNNNNNNDTTTPSSSLVTLPLLPCSPSFSNITHGNHTNTMNQETINHNCLESKQRENNTNMDMNKVSKFIPKEKDFLRNLLQGARPTPTNNVIIITPRPVRPVGSIIKVGCIKEDSNSIPSSFTMMGSKKPEEIERDVENDASPSIISDSNNKVRLANFAYKEMVGQPKCSWLDSMMSSGEKGLMGDNMICGEVMLDVCDPKVLVSSNGFSCLVRIEWGSNENNNKKFINAFCDVIRLYCTSRDYLFAWRFHTKTI